MKEILIVDDEPKIRELLSSYLEAAGYRCHPAEDVGAAKRRLAERSFSLIVSDLNLPDASGIDLIHHIHDVYPGTPVIVVSVIDNPADARLALDLGVYGYIVKPFTRNIVLINVENAFRRKHLETERKVHLEKLESLVDQRTRMLNNQLLFERHLMDAIPNPIFFKNVDSRFEGCNAAFEDLVGARCEDVLGKRIDEIHPDINWDFIDRTDRQLMEHPGKLTYEMTITDRCGTPRHIMFNKATYQDTTGEIAGFVGVLVDITDRKNAEEALRVSEEKLRQVAEHIGIGVAMVSPAKDVIWSNGRMREWFPEIQTGQRMCCPYYGRRPSDEPSCDDCPTVKAMRTGTSSEVIRWVDSATGKRHFRLFSNPVLGSDGQVVAIINLVEDVTEKIVHERDLRQAQKLESIGQLAAGIAHEINTPTQYIGDNTRFIQEATADVVDLLATFTGLLDALKSGVPTKDLVQELEHKIETVDLDYLKTEIPLAIEQTLEGVSRVSDIVSSMRHFSHPGSDRKSPVDINRALSSTITVTRNAWKYVADLETDFDANLPKVFCLPGEINQVFLNLLINAAQAIENVHKTGKNGKGLIRVVTRHHQGIVEIRISDSGEGIPASIRDRIFDPFFTTKPIGHGTGQGLAIAHSLITDKHAGVIRFETREGHGTTFVIELPVRETGDGNTEEA